jgi:hypothetical protein
VRVVVNLGGEGEEPGAINVNAFIEPMMWDRLFDQSLSPNLVIRRSAHDTGLSADSVDVIIANHFPIQFDEFVIDKTGARAHISLLAAEVFRILRPGGHVRFACSSCDRSALALAFEGAGLQSVAVAVDGSVEGYKP